MIRSSVLTLALDTTSRRGSAALLHPDGSVDCLEGDASRTHGERLPGEIIALLARNNVELKDIDLYAVAAGPGSFTGLRIGIATMQGFALVHGRPVVAVSALEALAHAAARHPGVQPDDLVGVWIDAHRREVFSALYRYVGCGGTPGSAIHETPDTLGELAAVDGPAVAAPADTLRHWAARLDARGAWLIGDGTETYPEALSAEPAIRIIAPAPPLAPTIARLAVELRRRGDVGNPHAVRPIYVRRPDAELARDRRASRP
jgi:tRNA threonylcarbamoyladenosine biosynthesis protein TsaB